jgi:hypothetical protein
MAKKIGEILATDFMKFEFQYDDKQLEKEAVLVRASWWNNYHGDWESSREPILIPLDKIDDFVQMLLKAKSSK